MSGKIEDVCPTEPIANFRADIDGPAVVLSWEMPSAAWKEILIERAIPTDPFKELTRIASATNVYRDESDYDRISEYRIRPLAGPCVGDPSPTIRATTAPRKVNALSAMVDSISGAVYLTWTDPNQSTTNYKVTRTSSDDGTSEVYTTTRPAGFSDSSVVPDRVYVYSVSAENGASSEASIANVKSKPNPAVSLLASPMANAEIALSWVDTNNHESGYMVERSNDGSVFAAVASLPASTISFEDVGLLGGTTYFYRIRSTNETAIATSSTTTALTFLPPNLAWSTASVLDSSCKVTETGTCALDSRLTFSSATGNFGSRASMTAADATGMQGTLLDFSLGTFTATWSVTDSSGTSRTLTRTLNLSETGTVSQTALSPPTAGIGNDAMKGRQVWFASKEASILAGITGCKNCRDPRGSLTTGITNSCVLTPARTVLCWGENNWGQTGDGTNTDPRLTPVGVVCPVAGPGCASAGALLSNVEAVSSGDSFTCALLETGHVRCWGNNYYGTVGDGTSQNSRLTPTTVVCRNNNEYSCLLGGTAIQTVVAVASGNDFACALYADGHVVCWGLNDFGELGFAAAGLTSFPSAGAIPGIANAISIAAGAHHACAVINDGTARCWGNDFDGQLGDGTSGDMNTHATPVTVKCGAVGDGCAGAGAAQSNIVAIAAGFDHSCALLSTGVVRCWGANAFGQLGNGTSGNIPQLAPANVVCGSSGFGCSTAGSTMTGVIAVSARYGSSCALLSTGGVRCWGESSAGQIGDGTTGGVTHIAVSPKDVLCGNSQGCAIAGIPLDRAVAVDANGLGGCALMDSGTIKCWGGATMFGNSLSPIDICSSGVGTGCSGGAIFTGATVRKCSGFTVSP